MTVLKGDALVQECRRQLAMCSFSVQYLKIPRTELRKDNDRAGCEYREE